MPFYNKTRKVWVGRIRIQGTQKQRSFKTKKEAKGWEAEARKLISQKNQTDTICLLDFINLYLDYSKEKFVHKTYHEKLFAFRALLNSIDGTTPVEDITTGDVLKHLRKQNLLRSGNSANKDRKNLIAGWNWGLKYIENFPLRNPFQVERFAEKRTPRYIPSKEDFNLILAVAKSDQDRCLLICYLHTGARRSELFNLKWSDISWTDHKLRLKTMKRKDGISEYNWLPLTETLYKCLTDHRTNNKTAEYVFLNPRTGKPYIERKAWMKTLCKRAEVNEFGFHSIRHLTASILVENDVPLIDIQTILRHKSITTTEKYLHRLKSVRTTIHVLEI